MKTKSFHSKVLQSICILFIIIVFSQCTEEVQVLPKTNEELVISEFIANNSDFSEFNELLKSSGLVNLLSIRGPYSLFLPNNSAMYDYYKEKNIKSFADLDSLGKRNLVLNHLVPTRYSVSDFQLGTLGTKNALGDNIVTEFQGAEIIINKYARIIKRDTKVSNGTIQIIDKVLDPVILSVYDLLASNPSYSIFTEGLKRTGLIDTLNLISFNFGNSLARTRYTILAITDTTFKRYGINSIDDLINKYSPGDDAIYKNPNNGLYAFMDYHCLDKEAYYFSDFQTGASLYSVLSKNSNVQIKVVNNVLKINADSSGFYTGIYLEQSDIPSKNGVIHTIDKLLEVSLPPSTVLIWEVTDYFDLKQGEYYLNHFQKFFDTAQFSGIRWQGEYLQYYIKPSGAQTQLNYDCLNMMGFWTIEVTTPKIMKGKYSIAARVWDGPFYNVYIDGVFALTINRTTGNGGTGHVAMDNTALYSFGNVDWKTTTQHKIRLEAIKSSTLFWDRVEFTPIP
jgi:uncharacterized surface protein with fasciclin (FAS1) repeats